jgi:hypothetical protein
MADADRIRFTRSDAQATPAARLPCLNWTAGQAPWRPVLAEAAAGKPTITSASPNYH